MPTNDLSADKADDFYGGEARWMKTGNGTIGWAQFPAKDKTERRPRDTPMKTKSALSYFGSDASVAGELAAMLDHCKHVTIPFCGGMSILPHLKARAVVANDLNALAINFYRVASGRLGAVEELKLHDMCEHTISHPEEMKFALVAMKDNRPHCRAWAYWAVCWIGRKGKGGTDAEGTGAPSVRWRATGGNNATRLASAASDLEAWAEHFKRCEWTQVDFRQCLAKVSDSIDCGIYIDAPWVGAGDSYIHKFDEEDHRNLAELLGSFAHATVVVRYGDHPLIRELYRGWRIVDAESRTQANKMTGEIWITNTPTGAPPPDHR